MTSEPDNKTVAHSSDDPFAEEAALFLRLQQFGCDLGRSKKGRLLRVDNRPCAEPLPLEVLRQLLLCSVLKELYLRNADEFLNSHASQLSQLKKLKVLDVEGTGFTDSSLHFFRNCPALQVLNVRSTKVTEGVVAELRKAMINTRIIF